uniref:Phospholipase B-like n=1 Tax=Neobodo designis TaxID=312471 RepID=A0A7S1MC58_NEODS|mmetsp:Transcript_3772/g.11949  ORF Transcript_3772/g.11949 Transcript_3772/m.11949 type:complete len:563 (+) Transcript_3772:41-1729(+)
MRRSVLLLFGVLALGAAVATAALSEEFEASVAAASAFRARHLGRTGGSDLVSVRVNDTMNTTGWIALKVDRQIATTVDPEGEDAVWYAAGHAEGAATAHRIDQIYSAVMVPQLPLHPQVRAFVEKHFAFMHTTSAAQRNASTYWRTVHRVLLQVRGIADGYAASGVSVRNNLTHWDVFLLNYNYELGDIQDKYGVSGGIETKTGKRIEGGGCSALVKVTSDDILMGHTTWTGYNMMLKAWKDYNFAMTPDGKDRQRVQMSSVPGAVASGDDWYQVSPAALLVTETTHYNYNQELYAEFVIPETVSEFVRVMVANHIGTDGITWVNAFARYNSGTYNNAYTVVDLKLFTPGVAPENLPDNLVWLTEQLPGMCPSIDVTPIMRGQGGYWSSYNRPAIPIVFNASGFRRMCDAYGALFCYETYPRGLIFKRNASDAVNQATFQDVIRYNNFMHDPLSVCATCSDPPQNPWLAIAARGDLSPPGQKQGNWSAFLGGPSADGGIDAKVGSYSMYHAGRGASVIAGPTHVQQPVFVWSESIVNGQVPHDGQPDRFDFDWVNPTSELLG